MPDYRVTAAGGLNVRSGPGTEYEIIGELVVDYVLISPDTTGWLPVVMEDDTIGWASAKYLVQQEETAEPAPVGKDPVWLTWARSKLGVKEIPGVKDNPEIVSWHKLTTLPKSYWTDETAWCATFVNAALVLNGVKSIGSARAFDYAKLGKGVSVPQAGDIVIFSFSHVAFYLSGYSTGSIKALGGNQNNAVTIATYNEDSVQEYRRPV